ncbi:MAG TPA: hypothetical protein PLL53_07630 [Saprospiraceae bacterium]|nr:hypothetical protein [Saprospiraceae bacterium]
MKAKFIFTLLAVLPISVFGQINQSIDFVGGIEYSFRHLTTSSQDIFVRRVLDDREAQEIGKLNWRVGFNYNRKISNNIFFKTGLRFASIGYKGEKITGISWGSEHDGMGGWILDPSLPHEFQLVYDYWFTEIPMAGRFEINRKKLSPFFELGVAPSMYLTSRKKTVTDIGKESEVPNGDIQNFNRFHIVGFISFGLNYSLNDQFQLFGQPVFRYHFTPLADAPISEYLLNYGIEIGIRRKIN